MLGYGRFNREKKSVNDDAFSIDGAVDFHPFFFKRGGQLGSPFVVPKE